MARGAPNASEKKLIDAQIADLKLWVSLGAPDPRNCRLLSAPDRPWPFRAAGEQNVVISVRDTLDPIATVIAVELAK